MPKLIENLRDKLLSAAERQIRENGYAQTTVRSVAEECGVAVGTVYNYFESKEMLIASFMAKDWLISLDAMRSLSPAEPKAYLMGIGAALSAFAEKYMPLFSQPEAIRSASVSYLTRHRQLRDQLAALIAPIAPSNDGFTAEFVAEALLTWTIAGKPFERIYEELSKIIESEGGNNHEQL